MSPSENNLSRRNFLKTAGLLGLGSALAATGLNAADQLPTPAAKDRLKVPRRKLGKTGVEVSCLSLGGMFDITTNQLLLKQALNWGVTYWDTADCYNGGNSETGIGQFFARIPEARQQVFLVTKSDARDPKGMTKLLDRSLERLQTDHIDLYFLHGISNASELTDAVRTWAEQARAAGKIKLFGFSTHANMELCLHKAAGLGWIDAIMFRYDFRLMHAPAMKNAVEQCARAGIGLTAMKTQGGGPVKVDSEAELALAGRFLQKGFTDRQARLKAVWENEAIAAICSQMPSLAVLTANVAAALDQTKLSALDHDLLQQFARETRAGYCAGCARVCAEAVGHHAPVADVMRCLMYYHSYGDRDLARAAFAELPAGTRTRLAELDYGPAERSCPQGLPIGRLMHEAGELLA